MPRNMDTPSAPGQRSSGRRLRLILMGTAILVCGMLIGGAVTSRIAWKRFIDRTRSQDRITERIAGRLDRDLDLSDDQARRIRDIIHRHQKNLRDLHLQVKPQVEEELDQMKCEVDSVLTPEQVRQWNRRFQRMHEHWINGGPPPPPELRGQGMRHLRSQGRRHAPPPGAAPPDSVHDWPPPESQPARQDS